MRNAITPERIIGLMLMALPVAGWVYDHFWVQAPLSKGLVASCTNTLIYLAEQLAACSPP